jgi:signal transduction histidine kinase
MKRLFRSSAAVLAVGYVVFGVVALVLFAVPLWYAWQRTVEEGRAEILSADAQRLSEVFRRSGAEGLKAFIDERVGLQIPGERILLVTDAEYRPVAGNLPEWPRSVPAQAGTYTVPLNLQGHLTRAVVVHDRLDNGYNLLVGRDTARFVPVEQDFWTGLAGAVAVLAIVGVLGGLMIRRVLMMRIQGIQETVQAIMQGRLSHRLETSRSGDELDTLSQTINGMLEQIEHLINGVRNVSNSIAHDLRTPLAELRSRLEELSLTRPPPGETFVEIDAALADVDRVIAIFNALLRLAQIDSGMRRSGFVPLDAAKVAADAVEFYLPAAELKGVSLIYRGNGPAPTSGDPVLLAQAVSNLIDNALKYVPPGGTVSVNAERGEGDAVEIAVADNGPGVADSEKPRLVERFYRGDASRGTPGVGLGLSVVDAVAKLHGGFLKLADNNPGLRARLVVMASGPHIT